MFSGLVVAACHRRMGAGSRRNLAAIAGAMAEPRKSAAAVALLDGMGIERLNADQLKGAGVGLNDGQHFDVAGAHAVGWPASKAEFMRRRRADARRRLAGLARRRAALAAASGGLGRRAAAAARWAGVSF